MSDPSPYLFPPVSPSRSGMLAVDDLHTIYWEEVGNPQGVPVLFLHGGPGAGTSPQHRRFFDPRHYRVILFDQRGAGKSQPVGETRNNTTQLLIEDIETLRAMFGIEQWLVFGGSWGSTLALAYGQAHPERCLGFVLRGIFLCTRLEIDWFINGAQWFHPEIHEEFVEAIPPAERGDLLQAYYTRIMDPDPDVYWPAVRGWSRFEGRRVFLMPQPAEPSCDSVDLGLGRLEAHYMVNLGFFDENQLLRDVDRIAHLPAVIVQGRYDVICPPVSAWRLHQRWPGSQIKMVPDAGHAAMETGISRELVAATELFRRQGRFA
ncbi:prolyl aminopeptidase [Pseudoduganella plicata]|uniref:Proline iminopeptidase n=1 Tax=Pseudoduganella plicata TaxID=321984 RepID=A0A4P7BGM9_9BURK|nr:prolyl aminopeptidase [Pseudoduganella plicata]QBQ37392.1 prolyl aminopeptidase [Pseudoduganella plicata]GGZ08645.1 proline iminopeptidase [Pseudoduganella plicata]